MDSNLKFWDRVAKLYTPLQEKSNRALYNAVIEHCKPYIHSGCEVLELACGTGQFTFSLCGLAKSWHATDFSSRMVEEGRRHNTSSAIFAVQDATGLTYPDASFDVVLIANALHVMPEPGKALAEIRRVLRPGGVLLAPTFVYEGKINRLRIWVMEKAGFKTFYHWDQAGLAQFVTAAGFELLRQELIVGELLPESFLAVRKPPEPMEH